MLKKIPMKMRKIIYGLLGSLVIGLSSCGDDFLETEFTDGVDKATATELAASDPEALNGYLRGMLLHLTVSDIGGSGAHDDFSFMAALHATEMGGENIVQASSHWFNYDYDFDNREYNYRRTLAHWKTFYTLIAKANEVIDFFPEVPENAGSKGILGQAHAMRGMAYYYLIQLYQYTNVYDESNLSKPGVPLRYAGVEVAKNGWTEEEVDAMTGRNTVADIYEQIEYDLELAVELLDAGYVRPNKVFVNASVAKGLLARYYLLSGQWEEAASTAKEAIKEEYSIMGSAGLHDGFMDVTNNEWMWGFDHNTETQTSFASFFSHISNIAPGYAGANYAARLIDARLYNSISDTDERKKLFVGPDGPSESQLAVATTAAAKRPYANLKFGNDGSWTMDYVYMRAAEMVLIEAEALAQQDKNTEAASALKVLMSSRDSEWDESSVDVDYIFNQRRIELWGEGFEYFDRKRLGKGMDRTYEGSNHRVKVAFEPNHKNWVYQIPNAEIQENDNISMDDKND